MPTLNRTAIVLRPKQPFIDWINACDPDGRPVTLEEVSDDNTVYLISEDRGDNVERALGRCWREIFEEELFGWYTDEAVWPKRLTYAMFQKWFEVKAHSVVHEFGDDALVVEED